MNPLVSIIIPTYNRFAFLGETLESLRSQLYQNWECIIVDDGSTDYTEELVSFYSQKDERIKFFRRPDSFPKGANSCRNFGFEMSNGQYINWFDDDDVMLPDFLLSKINNFEPEMDLVICSFYKTNQALQNYEIINLEKSYSLFKSYALYELKIITHSILFKKEFLNQKELFLADLEWGEETELYLRLFFNSPGLQYEILNKPLFLYRQHDLSKSTYNRGFVKKLNSSSIFIAFENIKRGIIIKDKEIISFFYKQLISLFFRSLNAEHKVNAKRILKELIPITYQINKTLSLELITLGNGFLFFNKGIYGIRKRWMDYFQEDNLTRKNRT